MSTQPMMSISGVRGIVGESITEAFCTRLAYEQTRMQQGKTMIVARDSRTTGPELCRAVFRGIHAAGGNVLDIGIAPTPTACVAVEHTHASGGIIITASHNPSQYNGYKMIHSQGRLFNADECKHLYSLISASTVDEESLSNSSAHADQSMDAGIEHRRRILDRIDSNLIRNSQIHIAIDATNGAAPRVYPALLDELQVTCSAINDSPDGNFAHNPEPRPEHLRDLQKLLHADAKMWGGFAFDPDADRLASLSESGDPISEEYTLGFAAANILARKSGCIATNLSTSMLIDDIARSYNSSVIRTIIGEANVVEALRENNCILGGEGNGGVIYPPVSSVRDGLCALALIIELMARTHNTLSQLTQGWPRYYMHKEKITLDGLDADTAIARAASAFPDAAFDTRDGCKMILGNTWVHLRASNTEPILRCYTEAPDARQAQELAAKAIESISAKT